MKLDLHQNAIINFNEKASNLISQIKPDPNSQRRGGSSIPQDIVVKELQVEAIEINGYVSELEGEIAKTFTDGKNLFGLFDEGYRDLIRLAEAMQRTKNLSPYVSIKFLKDTIFAWIADSLKRETEQSMCEFVLNKCEEQIKEFEVWLPVHRFSVESEFEIGKVKIKTIKKQMIDDWQNLLRPHSVNSEEEINIHFAQEREKLQGFAAITMKFEAEHQRASEIILEEAEKTLSVLRLFTGASFHPRINSFLVLLGREHYEGYTELIIKDDNIITYSENPMTE